MKAEHRASLANPVKPASRARQTVLNALNAAHGLSVPRVQSAAQMPAPLATVRSPLASWGKTRPCRLRTMETESQAVRNARETVMAVNAAREVNGKNARHPRHSRPWTAFQLHWTNPYRPRPARLLATGKPAPQQLPQRL